MQHENHQRGDQTVEEIPAYLAETTSIWLLEYYLCAKGTLLVAVTVDPPAYWPFDPLVPDYRPAAKGREHGLGRGALSQPDGRFGDARTWGPETDNAHRNNPGA